MNGSGTHSHFRPTEINFSHVAAIASLENSRDLFHPVPISLWNAIIGFHRLVGLVHAAECVTFHKWSQKDGRYHTIIPWQNSTPHPHVEHKEPHPLDHSRERGYIEMHNSLIEEFGGNRRGAGIAPKTIDFSWDDPRNVALLDEYRSISGEDFLPACIVHSRVNSPAAPIHPACIDRESSGWLISIGRTLSKSYDIGFSFKASGNDDDFIRPPNPRKWIPSPAIFESGEQSAAICSMHGSPWWHPFLGRVNPNPAGGTGGFGPALSPHPEIGNDFLQCDINPASDDAKTWENHSDAAAMISKIKECAPLTKLQSTRIAVAFADSVFGHIKKDAVGAGVHALAAGDLQRVRDWLDTPADTDSVVSSKAWEAGRRAQDSARKSATEAWVMHKLARSARMARSAAREAAGSANASLIETAMKAAKDAVDASGAADLPLDLGGKFVRGDPRWDGFSAWEHCHDIWKVVLSTSDNDSARVAASSVAFAALSADLYDEEASMIRTSETAAKKAAAMHALSAITWANACAASWAGESDAMAAAKFAIEAAGSSEACSRMDQFHGRDGSYYDLHLSILFELDQAVRSAWNSEACAMIRRIMKDHE